jgi:glycosyltransferase involved in cell wall biosynthesis
MTKVFYSFRTSIDRGSVEAFAWGRAHYSYKIVKDRFLEALTFCGYEPVELIAPEIYKTEKALEFLRKQHEIRGELIHIIFKPAEEIRLLDGAKNILVFFWEHSDLLDFSAGGLCLGNQQRTIAKVDEFWASSTHIANVLERAGVSKGRIKLIPCPIPNPLEPMDHSFDHLMNGIRFANLGHCLQNLRKNTLSNNATLIVRGGVTFKILKLIGIGNKLLDNLTKRRDPIIRIIGAKAHKMINCVTNAGLSILKRMVPLTSQVDSERIELTSIDFPAQLNLGEGLHRCEIRISIKNLNRRAITICPLTDLDATLQIKGPNAHQIHLISENDLILGPNQSTSVTFRLSNEALNIPKGKHLGCIELSYTGRRVGFTPEFEFMIKHHADFFNEPNVKVFCTLLNPFDERKNLNELIASFAYIAHERNDAVLIIKLIVDLNQFPISDLIRHLGTKLQPYRFETLIDKIYLVWDFLSNEQLATLFKNSDFYFMPSLGEGLALPILESMSYGVVPIAPNHSAMADYLRESNSILLPSAPALWKSDLNPQAGAMRLTNQVLFWDLVGGLRRACELDTENLNALRKSSHAAATNYFVSSIVKLIKPHLPNAEEQIS